MINKINSFLGLARKANKLLSGDETCENAICKKEAKLIIVSCDASDNTVKKFTDKCKFRNIPMRLVGEKEVLGKYIGKKASSVIVILDIGFAQKLIEMIDLLKVDIGGDLI